jgi:hypothetical protein
MTTIITLVLGPTLALLVLRFWGPVRLGAAIAAAVAGQALAFTAYAVWQRVRLHTAPVVFYLPNPTVGGRLMAIGVLLMIAILVATVFMGVQFALGRLTSA